MNPFPFPLRVLVAALVLAGCSTATPPAPLARDLPTHYREPAAALDGAWAAGHPSDHAERGAWWRLFGDDTLNGLVVDAATVSPTLALALARVQQSRAAAGLIDASRAVTLDAGFGPTRIGTSRQSATAWSAPLSFSYEVDLFGRLASNSQAAMLDLQAQEAAYRSVLLALQSDVAQQYFLLRALDAEIDVLQQSVVLREAGLKLAQHRYRAGDTSEMDVAQAATELAVTGAERESVVRERSLRDHALAILLGKAPAEFTLVSAPFTLHPVDVPPGLPSTLLERRPDIAQAQRQLAAGSARIGAAKAAFFPKLVLTGAAGAESSQLHNLFNWSSRSWILGPVLGTVLSLPILDGGRNKATLARNEAEYDALVASYRQQVLIGFREVEDNLSAMRTLDRQLQFENQAVSASQLAARLADSRYRNGATSYFEVIDAQRSSLSAQRARVRSAGARAVASVGLIRALGGGWATGEALPATGYNIKPVLATH